MKSKVEKHQYLLENGWWCHYNPDCWFETSKDNLRVEGSKMVGFRPEVEGTTLEEAYLLCSNLNQNNNEKNRRL